MTTTRVMTRLLAALSLGAVFACTDDEAPPEEPSEPPAWISLANASPPPIPDAPMVLRLAIPAEGWAPLREGRHGRQLGVSLSDLPWASDRGLSLEEEGADRRWELDEEAGLRDEMQPGRFGIRGDRLFVQLAPAAPSPGTMTLRVPLEEGQPREGRWRTRVAGLSSDGFLLTSAGSVDRPVPALAERTLRFATSALGVPGTTARLVVRDSQDSVLFETEVTAGAGRRFHRAPLSSREAGHLRFAVEGSDVLVAIHAPALSRKPASRRPDIVLFLADTFRADNLRAYGSTDSVTPQLDAFCDGARVWRHAWAPANWTLPSHASMLFGVHPMQHGAVFRDRAVAAGLVSMAECLHAAGYRTAAFTDAVFVSHRYGLDQGFEWFREREDPGFDWTLDQTLVELEDFLADDDGRPRFVFVQTYRAHSPFKVADATRAALADRLPMEASFEQMAAMLDPLLRAHLLSRGEIEGDESVSSLIERLVRSADWREQLDRVAAPTGLSNRPGEVLDRLRANYLGGVADLDTDFGRFLELLRGQGISEADYVGFLSDHGESFGEHSTLFHGEGPWDELLRVPIVLRGPKIQRGVSLEPASLVDLAPTLCRLLDLEPDPGWVGRALDASAPRPVLAMDPPDAGDTWAVWIDEEAKLVFPIEDGLPAGQPQHMYRYREDPAEQNDLRATGGDDGPALERVDTQRMLDSWKARGPPRDAALDADFKRQLEKIGYVDPGK